MNIHGWKFERKKEKWIVQKDQKWKKKVLNKSKRKKWKEKKEEEVKVQFELYYVKVSGIGIIWKEKLCSTSL